MPLPHREQLAEIALFVAFTKAATVSAVRRLLMAAQQQCMSYMQCHNTFEADEEIVALGEKIAEFAATIPDYSTRLLTEFGHLDLEKFANLDGSDIWNLRMEDIVAQGLPEPPQDEPLPNEDPLDIYIRAARHTA